ncbi:MAG: hypothetical protein ACI9EF_001737 [Pseudohongiellaceae bacterium]|jgi:hypothetical protein
MTRGTTDVEIMLAAGLVIVALLPVVLSLFKRSATLGAVAAVLGIAAIGGAGWASHNYRDPPVVELDLRPRESPTNGYVTSKTCRACHAEHYATWQASYHSSMTQVASPDTVIADFDDVDVHGYGWDYKLSRQGDEFFVEMDPVLGLPAKRRVVMTTGSHAMQDVWVTSDDGNFVELVESVFLFSEERWVPREAVFLQPPRGPAPRSLDERDFWTNRCIRCHSTGPQPRAELRDTVVGEISIACEACHGPASEHVALNSDPRRRYEYHLSDKADETIVDPGRLSPRAASQVCGACHSHAAAHRNNDGQWGSFPDDGSQYLPGRELEDSLEIDKVTSHTWRPPAAMASRFWPDGMVRGSGREYSDLNQSPCFNGGLEDGQMSCLSCHAMHKPTDDSRELEEWANDQLRVGMAGDKGCAQCHPGLDTAAHTHHQADSSGSRCYNCHSPYTNYGLLKSIRAHLNTNPDVATTLATGRPNACNSCHLDKSLGWTADRLSEWYETPRPVLTEEQESVASSVLWALRGDAAQRALTAASMGRDFAQNAAGAQWLAPYLLHLMKDPYDAVRYVAYHSLLTVPGFEDMEFDYVAKQAVRNASVKAALTIWNARAGSAAQAPIPALLLGADGLIDRAKFFEFASQRDERLVGIEE